MHTAPSSAVSTHVPVVPLAGEITSGAGAPGLPSMW